MNMSKSEDYKINEFINVKLKDKKTSIYVKGKYFRQCKYLLIVNPHENPKLQEINSIDEASEYLNNDLELRTSPKELGITPEEIFWGHCSNLQAWVEHDYDTRLLHRNLAFPLLKKLADVGDRRARVRLNEELAKRITYGYPTVLQYIFEQNYFNYLNKEELEFLFSRVPKPNNITKLHLSSNKLHAIPRSITRFKSLKRLDLSDNSLRYLPHSLRKLTKLEILDISNNSLKKLPLYIEDFKELKRIYFYGNPIDFLPKYIWEKAYNLFYTHAKVLWTLENTFNKRIEYKARNKNIIELNLTSLNLKKVPKLIFRLQTLEKIDLSNNQLKTLPKKFALLKNLKFLMLSKNKMKKMPSLIRNFNLLKDLELDHNRLERLPDIFNFLNSLGTLKIEGNKLKKLPKSMQKLHNLWHLNVKNNCLREIPDYVINLPNLLYINYSNNPLNENFEAEINETMKKYLNFISNLMNSPEYINYFSHNLAKAHDIIELYKKKKTQILAFCDISIFLIEEFEAFETLYSENQAHLTAVHDIIQKFKKIISEVIHNPKYMFNSIKYSFPMLDNAFDKYKNGMTDKAEFNRLIWCYMLNSFIIDEKDSDSFIQSSTEFYQAFRALGILGWFLAKNAHYTSEEKEENKMLFRKMSRTF